jgi:hypothetical protein
MKKMILAATFATLFTFAAQAETVGLYIGGQIWQSGTSGTFGEKNTPINANLKKEHQSSYFVAVEHPLPFLPNVRISNTSLSTTGNTNLTQESSFDDEIAHINVKEDIDVDAQFDVSYIDYTLYYELFGNDLFSFDLGLTGRDFNGSDALTEKTDTITTSRDFIWDDEAHDNHDYHNIIETANTVTMRQIKTHDIMPMLYIATSISLPLMHLSIFAQGDFSLKDDHSFYDYQVGLNYDLVNNRMMDLNLLLGYRAEKIEFEDLDSLYTDLEFKGAFVGVVAHF